MNEFYENYLSILCGDGVYLGGVDIFNKLWSTLSVLISVCVQC